MAPSANHAARYPRAQFAADLPPRGAGTAGAGYPASSGASGSGSGAGAGAGRGGDRGTDEPETKRGRKAFSHRGLFARDVRALLYAYGDSPHADPASVDLLEDLTADFLTDLCHRARPSAYALPQGPGMRALVPVSEIWTGAELHPAAISALASSSTPQPQPQPQNQAQTQSQIYAPLPAHVAGHPYYTRARIKVDDLKHALRKDGKKYARVEELLFLDKVIKEAKRQMDVDVEAVAAVGGSGSGGAS
ncbi:hypothetical protein A4X06_0g621 [Tilletia controversa]|uniref:Transcription initiation factor TFIID subunit 13 n=1 Tax=Tilletia controversa TaxID=13291 RepID=A0A8X7MZR4_9BASI|nr:hypothetical protein CF328_g2308 [Tilletia controversa]KAE8255041.1 hypothetical protein A4X06_0g621 [Tilletia controversa]